MSSAPVATDALRMQPDGPGEARLLGAFHIATLVMQRAKQLAQGAHPRTEPNGHKVCRLALMEVLVGAVSWSVSAGAHADTAAP